MSTADSFKETDKRDPWDDTTAWSVPCNSIDTSTRRREPRNGLPPFTGMCTGASSPQQRSVFWRPWPCTWVCAAWVAVISSTDARGLVSSPVFNASTLCYQQTHVQTGGCVRLLHWRMRLLGGRNRVFWSLLADVSCTVGRSRHTE